ncbi:hypothetical protein BDZ91DRAFT_711954 [Kalaharituber pfeilii]|nr:hypothetical protein BDZ91DRAFT_711954 [Kalaharituber pfeilii]
MLISCGLLTTIFLSVPFIVIGYEISFWLHLYRFVSRHCGTGMSLYLLLFIVKNSTSAKR